MLRAPRLNPASSDYNTKLMSALHRAAEAENCGLVFAGQTKPGGEKYELYDGFEHYPDGDFTGEYAGYIVVNGDVVTLSNAGQRIKVKGTGTNASKDARAMMDVLHAAAVAGYDMGASFDEFGKGKLTLVG